MISHSVSLRCLRHKSQVTKKKLVVINLQAATTQTKEAVSWALLYSRQLVLLPQLLRKMNEERKTNKQANTREEERKKERKTRETKERQKNDR